MGEVPTAASYLFKNQMKSKPRLKFIPKHLALLLIFSVFGTQQVLASTYGSGAYGSCTYGGGCAPPAHKGFFDKYGWLIFLLIFLISLVLLLLLLLARRRKKDKDEDIQPPTSASGTKPKNV